MESLEASREHVMPRDVVQGMTFGALFGAAPRIPLQVPAWSDRMQIVMRSLSPSFVRIFVSCNQDGHVCLVHTGGLCSGVAR